MDALSVSQFLAGVNDSLQGTFPEGALVRGEVAEFHVSQNRWVWFKLKDEAAVVDCFMTVWDLHVEVADGMTVVATGAPAVFAKSGRFSLKVRHLKLDGEGALKVAYERLKARLTAEGVFAPEHKRSLPPFPSRIGLIASRESAAYTDFLRLLRDRWPGLTVFTAHVQVQGEGAVDDIVGAFRYFNAHPDLAEAVVLTRGGGSMEDLQAFNSEAVVRAVFSSRLPVICAVGHERDVTLADLAADVRAATPTHAAELLVPQREEVSGQLRAWRRQLTAAFRHQLALRGSRLDNDLARLAALFRSRLDRFATRLEAFGAASRHFSRTVTRRRERLLVLQERLPRLMARQLVVARERLNARERLLRAADPRRPLGLGYALVRRDGQLLRSVRGAAVGERLAVELHDGELATRVEGVSDFNAPK